MSSRSTFSLAALALPLVALFAAFLAAPLTAEDFSDYRLPPEELVYPPAKLCLLELRGEPCFPFDLKAFGSDLLAFLRSAEYLTVVPEAGLRPILERSRVPVPENYDAEALARIGRLAGCDQVVFMRLYACEIDRGDGFRIPVLFRRNQVTARLELDLAVVASEQGRLLGSQRVEGRRSTGRGIQIYPLIDDPDTHLGFRDRDRLVRDAVYDLARQTAAAVVATIHARMSEKFVCYWQDEVHIISDQPGLCPICGSRLVRIEH